MGKTASQDRETQPIPAVARSLINKDHLPHRAAFQSTASSSPLLTSLSSVTVGLLSSEMSTLSQPIELMAPISQTPSQPVVLPKICLLCKVTDSDLLYCTSCQSHFHPTCAHVKDQVSRDTWQCLICTLSSGFSIKLAYQTLARLQNEPIAPVIAYFSQETLMTSR